METIIPGFTGTPSSAIPGEGDVMTDKKDLARASGAANSSASMIHSFLAKAKRLGPLTDAPRARLVFALDATLSREPTWDLACRV